MNSILLFILIATLLYNVQPCLAMGKKKHHRKPPNIVFILMDDVGWANVGFNRNDNSSEVNTPNLDRLATQEGLILERFYTHYTCSPARTSLLSGRLPIHANLENYQPEDKNQGVPVNMTVLSEKVKSSTHAKYATHFVGKWDAGMASPQSIPFHRGFDSSLLYFGHMNDFWTKRVLANPAKYSCTTTYDQLFTDLWEDDQPAYELKNNLVYEDRLFADRVHCIINEEADRILNGEKEDEHDDDNLIPDRFLLMFHSHIAHFPVQIPKHAMIYDFEDDEYICNQFTSHPTSPWDEKPIKCRSGYAAQMTYIDSIIGDITDHLKSSGLWEDTLVVVTTDNGGSIVVNTTAGNNYPLKGGKFSPLEGGIRVPAIVTGGYLPKHRRGQTTDNLIHMADWYATFSSMVGVDPTDERAAQHNLPPIDSIDLSTMIMKGDRTKSHYEEKKTVSDGNEVMIPLIDGILGEHSNKQNRRESIVVDLFTVIKGEWKLSYHPQIHVAVWTGPVFPNATSATQDIGYTIQNCLSGCLFNIFEDPTEHQNVFNDYPSVVQDLTNELMKARMSVYQNENDTPTDCPFFIMDRECMCWMAEHRWDGFIGPYLKA